MKPVGAIRERSQTFSARFSSPQAYLAQIAGMGAEKKLGVDDRPNRDRSQVADQ